MSASEFRKNLQSLINCESMENGSNTPDFLLADYLTDCLAVFDKAMQAREKWYGRPIGGDPVEAPLNAPQ